MIVELRDVSKIKPYPGNPRQNDGAVDAIAKSIETFGFRQPIVIDRKGVVVAGHTRLKAAMKLGMKKVPVHVAKDLSPAAIKAYRLADNRLAELASWDPEKLGVEIAELKELGEIPLDVLGWSEEYLANLYGDATEEAVAPGVGATQWKIIVTCRDELSQAALAERLEKEGFACALLTS